MVCFVNNLMFVHITCTFIFSTVSYIDTFHGVKFDKLVKVFHQMTIGKCLKKTNSGSFLPVEFPFLLFFLCEGEFRSLCSDW